MGFNARAFAQATDWLLTTADFQTQSVALNAIDDKSMTLATPSSDGDPAALATTTVDLGKLLLLERAIRPAQGQPRFSVVLNDGDRAAGQPAAIEGDNLVWDTASLGRLTLPLKSVAAIERVQPRDARSAARASPTTAPQTEDVVTLINGDSVRGIIVNIDAQAVSVQQGGDKTPVPLDSIARVAFVSTGGAGNDTARKKSPAFRITLADSSSISAPSLRLNDRAVSMMLPAGTRSVPLDAVVSIEHINGPVTWLSQLTPGESVQTSLLDTTWPARMDLAVDGGPIRFGDRTYAHGIGVHSYSRLTFPIDPSVQSFRTQYAIAGELPYADVTVRIKLDGQTVHEQAGFHSGILPKPVILDVAGHKQLTLEVDYGGNADVQDRFNWIEPALLNFKP